MKQSELKRFWVGFALAAAAAALYWYWHQQQARMLAPGVVRVGQPPVSTSPAQALAGSVASQVAERIARSADRPVSRAGSVRSDRLEQIKGIGPVYAGRLYEAGIRTFAQLAQQTPERLAEVVRLKRWQASDPGDWIAAARKLAE